MTIWIGLVLGVPGYYYYERHTPTAIAKAKAQRAQEDRAVSQTLARAGCTSDMENRDDGRAPAEAVAKAIIEKCGAIMQFPKGSCSASCMRDDARIALQVETQSVLEKRYERAQDRADDAKAALERARSH